MGDRLNTPSQHPNGRWYSVRMKPFGETQNLLRGALIVLLDEDAVRRALIESRGSLAESESMVRALLDASPQAIFALSAAGNIAWANRTTAKMFGYDPEELPGLPLHRLIPESYRERLADHLASFFANPEPRPMEIGMELHARSKDGGSFPVEVGLGSVETRDGRLGVAFVADLTERRRLVQSLHHRDQEKLLCCSSKLAPMCPARMDSDLRLTHLNTAFEKLVGTARKDALGKTGLEIGLPKETVEFADARIRPIFATGQPVTIDLSIPPRGGGGDFEVRYIPEFAADGSVAAVFSIARDMTEQKRAEQALRRREQELASLFDNSPDIIIRLDRNLRVLYLNSAWERLTGIATARCMGKTLRGLGLPRALVEVPERMMRQVLLTGRLVTIHVTFPSAGGPVEQEVRCIPEFSADRSLSSILLIGRDVTEQSRLQTLSEANARDIRDLSARLMTAQEEERRRVARDIHDSFCQQLGALASELGGVASELSPHSPARERLQALQALSLRAADEAHQLAYQLHPVILDDLGLEAALQSLSDEFSEREGIDVQLTACAPARGSSPEWLPVCIASRRRALNNVAKHAQANHVFVRLTTGRKVRLTIEDDGIGFDSEATQSTGGLGLASMQERAHIAGGKLDVRAKPGHGVSIDLIIPSRSTAQ